MLFNSFQFIIFFIIVTSVYFLLPYQKRWILLLLSSCYFYMSFVPVYILILGFTIGVDYFSGIAIENTKTGQRKWLLLLSLVANIGVLSVFKYHNFVNQNFSTILNCFHVSNPIPYLSILLPIGLSFHTFQAMSYTIEVYRGNQKAEKHFGIFALYVLFYPQLVAGPIERPQNLLHQFREKFEFDLERIGEGLKMMLWGFVKKIVIADRLAIYVNTTYNHTGQHSGASLLLATIFFSFQIYCDFSAYSDIAIGTAKVMGFKLMDNFKRPYFAQTMAEFWKRWHISLSTWFKDYVYIPLGGNRLSATGWYMNLMVVFLLSGLWHGANWTYIIWGALNGAYLVFEILTKKIHLPFLSIQVPRKLVRFFKILLVFVLSSFAWIFFRANTVSDAFVVIKKIASFKGPLFYENPSMLIYSFASIFLLLLVEMKQEFYTGSFSFMHHKSWVVRNLTYAVLIITILLMGVFDGGQFIYFQF